MLLTSLEQFGAALWVVGYAAARCSSTLRGPVGPRGGLVTFERVGQRLTFSEARNVGSRYCIDETLLWSAANT